MRHYSVGLKPCLRMGVTHNVDLEFPMAEVSIIPWIDRMMQMIT